MTVPFVVVAACVFAFSAVGRVLTMVAVRTPAGRQYLAGRRDNLRVADFVVYGDELVVMFADDRNVGLSAHTWWTANEPSSRHRLERWRGESTWLRAYLSADGGIMLADPWWGGNVACEPALALH